MTGVLPDQEKDKYKSQTLNCLTFCPEACEESSLESGPDPVGEVEERGLDTEHEGDPLVVRGVGGLVTAVNSLPKVSEMTKLLLLNTITSWSTMHLR